MKAHVILLLLALCYPLAAHCQTNAQLQNEINALEKKQESDDHKIEAELQYFKSKMDSVKNLINTEKTLAPRFVEQAVKQSRDSLLNKLQSIAVTDTVQLKSIKEQLAKLADATNKNAASKARLSNLTEQLRSYSQSILILTKVKDIQQLSQDSKDALQAAVTSTNDNIILARENFGQSISAIHLDATTRKFLNDFSSSMIILDSKTNAKAVPWLKGLQKVLQAGAIVSAVLAYDSYTSEEGSGVAISSAVGAGLLVVSQFVDQNIDKRLQYSIDAMSRNVIYGEAIRQDSVFAITYKNHAVSAYQAVKYRANPDGIAIVDNDYWPSDGDLQKADLLVDDLQSASIFFTNVIAASEGLKNQSITPEAKKIIDNNVTAASSLLPLLQNYKANLEANIRAIRQINQDKATASRITLAGG